MAPLLWMSATSLLLVGCAFALYKWWRYSRFFARRGVPYAPPLPLVGNMLDVVLRRKSVIDVTARLYRQLEPHSYAGVYNLAMPVFLVRDPEIIHAITTRDFDHFTDHADFMSADACNPLLQRMVLSLKGTAWRDMRTKLTPAFSLTKMKNMFVLMSEIGQQMTDYLEKETAEYAGSSRNEDIFTVEMKDLFSRVANDIIATTAFGLKVNSLVDRNNSFYHMGRSLTNVNPLIAVGYFISPKIMQMLDIPFFDRKSVEFFRSMVTDTIRTREREGIVRPDMINLLLEARRGDLNTEEVRKMKSADREALSLSDDDIAAQALIFFFGGFENVSTALTFCSYLLATHKDVQLRLQEEVDELMRRTGGKPSYDQVMTSQYLDMVVSESLRMFPPAFVVDRQCVRPYRLPATRHCPGVELRPGDDVWVFVHALHNDPSHFPQPQRFDPQRFSPENKHTAKSPAYLPFGSGPRMCIVCVIAWDTGASTGDAEFGGHSYITSGLGSEAVSGAVRSATGRACWVRRTDEAIVLPLLRRLHNTVYPLNGGSSAQRFAVLEVKLLLVQLVSRFSLVAVAKTPQSVQMEPTSLTMAVQGGAWLGVQRRS